MFDAIAGSDRARAQRARRAGPRKGSALHLRHLYNKNKVLRFLFIEGKNEALEEADAALVKRYDDGGTKVAAQLHRSLDRMRQKFQW